MSRTSQLHLPDLSIKGFRGIEDLTINQLGRVTLLAGKNGVGKTTVLEAVRVYAARGRPSVITELLNSHDEVSVTTDEDGDRLEMPDITALFHGRALPKDVGISIGSGSSKDQLRIVRATLSDDQVSRLEKLVPRSVTEDQTQALKVRFQDAEQVLPWFLSVDGLTRGRRSGGYRMTREIRNIFNEDEPPSEIECESLGPDPMSNERIAQFWDAIALTDDEERAVDALRLILGEEVDRVAIIGDDEFGGRSYRRLGVRRAVLRLGDQARPVPLKSLGDGALRLYGVALALANCRDGFLVIDEAENGIHHSIQRDFWSMVLQTAHKNNVQVLATTHSYDCVRGFARAATESEESEGILVRIEREDGQLQAVEYTEENLLAAAEHSIEVR